MLKHAVLFAAAFCLVHSQRPWHAGTSGRLPAVLPQYLDEQAAAAQAAQEAQAAQAAPVDVSLANRIDGTNGAVESQITTTTTTTTTTIPPDLPVDAHGDVDLVNRIKTWPRDKQPFWYINWQAIQAHRGDVNNTAQPAQTQPNTQSFFAG